MRNFLMAAAVVTGLGVCTGAFAADYSNPFSTKTTAYLNFGFGGSGKNTDILSSLHYGLRLDQAKPSSIQSSAQPARPAFLQTDFNLRDGFSGAMVNGVRFASHVNKFDEDGGDTSYSLVDWSLLAIGAAGLGFGIAEVLKTKDSPAPKTTTQTVTGPNGVTQIIQTVNGVVTSVTTALGGSGTGTAIPANPVTGLTCSALGLLCFNQNYSAATDALAQRDIQRQVWLDSGMGQMGDLVTVR